MEWVFKLIGGLLLAGSIFQIIRGDRFEETQIRGLLFVILGFVI